MIRGIIFVVVKVIVDVAISILVVFAFIIAVDVVAGADNVEHAFS